MSRYNTSICDQQPPRRSQLLWLASRDRELPPRPYESPHESGSVQTQGIKFRRPTSRYLECDASKAGNLEIATINSSQRDSQRRSGIIGNPNALINRPKSAYTRNLGTEEEPVFWQHSRRTTSRFRRSHFSAHRPTSLASVQEEPEPRRSNSSNFESLLERTFTTSSTLNFLPNPVINIQPPQTPLLPSTPTDNNAQTPLNVNASVPPSPVVSSLELLSSRRRSSGFRPLQLSFYSPGNRLSLLPRFSDDHRIDHDIPPVPGITRPPSALLKTRLSSTLSHSSTSHMIPRKAVASHASFDVKHSNRPSYQSSVTLVDETFSRDSLHGRLQLDRTFSQSTKTNNQVIQSKPDGPRPPCSRKASRRRTENAKSVSGKRMSAQSLQLETHYEDQWHIEPKCPAIPEGCSPASSVSPVTPVSPISPNYSVSPVGSKKHPIKDYHDNSSTRNSQVSGIYPFAEYHDYEFTDKACHVPGTTEPHCRGAQPHVAPLRCSSISSANYSDDELPSMSKPRSSSGSSTLYHGESSSESDRPVTKAKLSIAFPSPTLRHRLSEWLSLSASQIQAFIPQQGECCDHADSPTLGFNWDDFGFAAEKQTSRGDAGSQHPITKTFTDASSASTYVNRVDDIDLRVFPLPDPPVHAVSVGVAF